MSDVGDRIAAIYGGPLDEFVSARDALVRELRQAGDREGAAEIKALRKPRALAWALDAAALAAPDAVADLAAAGGRGRPGAAGGGDVRAALADLRTAEAEVVAAAVEAAQRHGQRLDPARPGGAVRAVIADPGALADLRAGPAGRHPGHRRARRRLLRRCRQCPHPERPGRRRQPRLHGGPGGGAPPGRPEPPSPRSPGGSQAP